MKLHPEKTWLEVSASSLVNNYKVFERLVRPAAVMAVVKANAYGHGLAQTVGILEKRTDVAWYGVDNVDEGLLVRRLGVDKPVLLLGYTPLARIKEAVKAGLSLVVYNASSVREAARVATARHPAKLHLKVETGLNRQGVTIEELPAMLKLLRQGEHLWLEGVSTHYANIEDTRDPSYALQQLKNFNAALEALQVQGFDPAWKHTACSAAALLFPQAHFNLIRLGISLYGLWSSSETRVSAAERGLKIKLQPALTWKTIVAQVKHVPRGAGVGYGLTERVTRDSKIAVIPVGYADGYDRGLSGQGQALIRGHRCRILGRVAMDMFMVDVTDVPQVKEEDEVVLIGEQGREAITVEELAAKIGTVNYEVIARINPSLSRKIIK